MQITVNKEFLSDLRKCDCVVFRSDEQGNVSIELEKRKINSSSRKGWREDYLFENPSSLRVYNASCFVTLYKDISGWNALSKLLRVGDKISFEMFNNASERLTEAGLADDLLRATIWRKGKVYLNYLNLENDIRDLQYRSIKPAA